MRITVALTALICAQIGFAAGSFHRDADAAIEDAHTNLVERFMSEVGLLFDYRGDMPTRKDCEDCRPNAMGWWTPIENGPMFTGPYLRAMCERFKQTKNEKDRELCRKMASGLMRTARTSDVPGMIVRGFAADGISHYPLGSEDQTVPWFFGLHAYVRSGIPSKNERMEIVRLMDEVARALEKNGWKCPCDGRFKGEFRGNIAHCSLLFRQAAHYLYILAALAEVTEDAVWAGKYKIARDEKEAGRCLSRLGICEEGYVVDMPFFPVEGDGLWIYVCAQGCLAELARMEKELDIRMRYLRGLRRNAEHALVNSPSEPGYDNSKIEMPFKYGNWRRGYKWKEQKTQEDAGWCANTGDRNILGSRKQYERQYMTRPLSYALILAYAGNDRYRDYIVKTVCHYDYRTINICEFFMAECAWYACAFDSGI